MLKIRVHRHDGIAGGMLNTCREGRLVAEISGEGEGLDPLVQFGKSREKVVRVVTTPVIHEQQFELVRERLEYSREMFHQNRNRLGFVQNRDDDGDQLTGFAG